MKVTIKGFINYKKDDWCEGNDYHFHKYDMSEHGYVTVMPHEIEVEVLDDFDPRFKQVAALIAEKQKARAEFLARVTEIDRQIQSLLAIEHEVPTWSD